VEELTERRWQELAGQSSFELAMGSRAVRYGFWLSGAQRLARLLPCKGRSFCSIRISERQPNEDSHPTRENPHDSITRIRAPRERAA
jgi:hypothetical protein